jgi:hypothetical protein
VSADTATETPSKEPHDTAERPSTPPRSSRFVLVCGILAGLTGVVFIPVVSPEQFMLASDVYYYAADALLGGGDIYEVAPPDRPGFHYIYPPVVIGLFVPHALAGSPAAAYGIQTGLNSTFAAGIAVVLWRALGRRGVSLSRLDGLLFFGFALISAYSGITLVNGQVTIWLGFAIALGLDLLDRNRGTVAGVAFALAALVKVFPAVLGLWLLRRRAYRGVAIAILVGLSGLLAGVFALGPDVTTTYLTDVLTGRYDGFDGAPDPSQTRGGAQRQIAALCGLGPPALTPLAGLLLAPVVGYLFLDIETDMQRQATILGTLIGTLLFFPLQRLYMILFAFPLIILLYSLPNGQSRTVLVLGSLVSFVRLEYSLVENTIQNLPLGPIQSPLVTVSKRLFEVVLPPTLGMWLLLGACVLVHYECRNKTSTQ